MKFCSGIAAFFILFLAVSAVSAEEASYIRKNLNKNFAGQIIHPDGSDNSKDVLITVMSVSTDQHGQVTATGRGEFYGEDHKATSFEFSWKINPDTLRFEMKDKSSKGSYIGNISKGLDSIEAILEPTSGKKRGKLVLYSVVQLDP
ncbi:MAG: hypothetical protein ACRBBN_11235 [Methyloligellaceae bacterium]